MHDSERKYINAIFRVSRKYAAWDPELPVEVGDWGTITKGNPGLFAWRRQRGTFLKEGNIYKDGTAEKYDIPEPKEYGSDSSEGVSWFVSNNAEEVDVDVAAGGQTPALASCKVKAGFKFSSGTGAVLVMDKDSIFSIDPPGCLRRLLEEKDMQGRVLVSEVHRTSSYARFFTTHSGQTVSIGLDVEPPLTNAVSANVDAKWVCSSKIGNFKSKVIKSREFTPLFRLVSLQEGSITVGLRGEPPLPDAEPPWMETETENETESERKWPKLKLWSSSTK